MAISIKILSMLMTVSSALSIIPRSGRTSCAGKSYQVESGDDCWDLAPKFGMTLAALEKLNPNICGISMQPGQTLCLDDVKASTATVKSHLFKLPSTANKKKVTATVTVTAESTVTTSANWPYATDSTIWVRDI